MIKAEQLSKSYGKLKAVDNVSFAIQPGEIFGLLGPNGAGKTTTISMLCGLIKPDYGNVQIADYNLWETPKPAKKLIGLIPQETAIYDYVSARNNLLFFGGLYNLPRQQLNQRVDELLKWIGLTDRAHEPVRDFSGGMKRRLNLAAGLVHNPKIILLDEPTVGIDPQARNKIFDIVRQLATQGASILYTTHQLAEAEQICDTIAIMDHGTIITKGTVTELVQQVAPAYEIKLQGNFSPEQIQAIVQEKSLTLKHLDDHEAILLLPTSTANPAQLFSDLTNAEINLTSFTVKQPSLESIFLDLTGRAYRD